MKKKAMYTLFALLVIVASIAEARSRRTVVVVVDDGFSGVDPLAGYADQL